MPEFSFLLLSAGGCSRTGVQTTGCCDGGPSDTACQLLGTFFPFLVIAMALTPSGLLAWSCGEDGLWRLDAAG